MYNGEAILPPDSLDDFFNAAKKLRIKSLAPSDSKKQVMMNVSSGNNLPSFVKEETQSSKKTTNETFEEGSEFGSDLSELFNGDVDNIEEPDFGSESNDDNNMVEDSEEPESEISQPGKAKMGVRPRAKVKNTCLVCSKSFANPKSLKVHSSTAHTGPFQCNACEKSFSQWTDYKTHIQNIYPECADGHVNSISDISKDQLVDQNALSLKSAEDNLKSYPFPETETLDKTQKHAESASSNSSEKSNVRPVLQNSRRKSLARHSKPKTLVENTNEELDSDLNCDSNEERDSDWEPEEEQNKPEEDNENQSSEKCITIFINIFCGTTLIW